ncbi:MAG: DUF3047 domain-containing protein [Halopseudomonas sp.]|uniref:DUF3047 domain-containing protein n=1 Tax=Halopseudomonas sp. TaxID=2901191 RepID=UPI0030010B4E
MIEDCRPVLLGATLMLSLSSLAAPGYSPEQMLGWQSKDFAEPTEYQLEDGQHGLRLRAQCSSGEASALYLEQPIDLRKTPILRWTWTVSGTYSGIDETNKAGDDYPVRLYVVKDGGLLPWRTLAVNYVWSSHQPVGSHWPNAFTGNAQMLALRSGTPDQPGQMLSEQRNVREDFMQLHDIDLQQIDGLALMTDCDNAGQPVTGWYGAIEWLPATSAPNRR